MILSNFKYFKSEIISLLKNNKTTNLLAFVILVVLSFLSASVTVYFDMASSFANDIRSEAEIAVFINSDTDVSRYLENLNQIDGISEFEFIDKEKAKQELIEIAGDEIDFKDYSKYIAEYIKISLNLTRSVESIVDEIRSIDGTEYIRDNAEIIKNIDKSIMGIRFIGSLLVFSLMVAILISTYFILRSAITFRNKEIQILQLIGAPKLFIFIPFLGLNTIIILFASVISFVSFFTVHNIIFALLELKLKLIYSIVQIPITLIVGIFFSWIILENDLNKMD